MKEKISCWQKIAYKFNSETTNVQRSSGQLKTSYNNLKRTLKKDNDKVKHVPTTHYCHFNIGLTMRLYKTGVDSSCSSAIIKEKKPG